MIKTIGTDQYEMISDILKLHNDSNSIECDVTYSKGVFYKNGVLSEPKYKFDLYPQTQDTIKANANNLPLSDSYLNSLMFDPPFLAGYTKKPTGIIGERFHGFPYIRDLWKWYDECIFEHYRVLNKGGVYIFKCQDTVSSGKQHLSHVHIINRAEEVGFYTKDLFILTAKSRMIGHNHKNQQHARKFHCYFIVFKK